MHITWDSCLSEEKLLLLLGMVMLLRTFIKHLTFALDWIYALYTATLVHIHLFISVTPEIFVHTIKQRMLPTIQFIRISGCSCWPMLHLKGIQDKNLDEVLGALEKQSL